MDGVSGARKERRLCVLLVFAFVLVASACSGNGPSTPSAEPAPTGTAPPTATPTVEPTVPPTPITLPTPTSTPYPVHQFRETWVFDNARNQIDELSVIPARLPSSYYFYGDEQGHLRTTVDVSDVGYNVYLSTADWCPGSTVCTFATFQAALPEHPHGLHFGSVGVPVPLPNGLTGRYHDVACWASCSHGWVSWSEDSIDYAVGIKVGGVEDVLPLAWSAIDPTIPYPFEHPSGCSDAAALSPGGQSAAELVMAPGITWLVVCDHGETPQVNIVHTASELRWRNVTTVTWSEWDDEPEILVSDGDTTWVFNSIGGPVLSREPWGRLTVADPRCADVDGDGLVDFVDAASSELIVFYRPLDTTLEPIGPVAAEALPPC